MATITKRKSGWSVQVRRTGYSPRNKTFPTKAAALQWAREQEGAMDRGSLPLCDKALKTETLRSLLERYLAEVTPRKRSHYTETQRLRKLQRHSMCELPVRDLSPRHLSAYRDERLQSVMPGTVRRELGASFITCSTLQPVNGACLLPQTLSRMSHCQCSTMQETGV